MSVGLSVARIGRAGFAAKGFACVPNPLRNCDRRLSPLNSVPNVVPKVPREV
jgi:hypothetical protein